MTDLNSIPALTEDELETLGTLLEEEAARQDSFDFFAIHGLITALLSSPLPFNIDQVWDCAFDDGIGFNSTEKELVNHLLIKLGNEIQAWLESGDDFPIPADLTLVDEEDEPPLESWAIGYMTAVMLQEESWYQHHEEKIAEGLFPIMYASGLFAEEAEMSDIDEDIDLSCQMCNNIPATVIEVYLLLQGQQSS